MHDAGDHADEGDITLALAGSPIVASNALPARSEDLSATPEGLALIRVGSVGDLMEKIFHG